MADAARLGSTVALEILFEFNATLDPKAIFYAIGVGRETAESGTATMQILVNHGADVNAVGEWGTPLWQAVRMKSMKRVEWLLEKGADPWNALPYAQAYTGAEGRVEYVEVLERACMKSCVRKGCTRCI